MSNKKHEDFSKAEIERDALIAGTGNQYKVAQDENGLFYCEPSIKASNKDSVRETLELHPSNKLVISYMVPLVIGLLVYVKSEELTVAIAQILNNKGILEIVEKINGSFEFIGAALFGLTFLKYLHAIFSKTYLIDAEGVRLIDGIWAKDTKIIKYKDIKTPTLKKSYSDRLLNIGTLMFSSSGTGTVDMIFEKIDNPDEVLEYIIEKD